MIISEWLEESPANKLILCAILSDTESVGSAFDKDQLFDRIMGRINSNERQFGHLEVYRPQKNYVRKWVSVAASLILLLSVTLFIYNNSSPDQNLQEQQSVVLKSNPKGQKSTVFLNDGSKVFLNSGSSISYLQGFTSTERVVNLEGEAYFIVAHDARRPFRVISDEITVTALGTEFNVNSFDNDIRVALTEGKVAVQSKEDLKANLLTPGYQMTYNAEYKEFSKSQFDLDETVAWKNGKLVFRDARFNEIKERLELWYGVEIKAEPSDFVDWSITADFNNKSLEAVLDALKFAKGINYSLGQGIIEITN